MNAANYRPEKLEDFIGAARKKGRVLIEKIKREKVVVDPILLLLQGKPGTGKTRLAQVLAMELAGSKYAIEEFNGKEVGVDTVRSWMNSLGQGNIWSSWRVRLIHEVDLCSADARNLLLTYTDRIERFEAVFATCNPRVEMFEERFQSRFQYTQIENTSTDDVREWLISKWKLPNAVATSIAFQSAGNVRLALKSTQDWMDLQLAA